MNSFSYDISSFIAFLICVQTLWKLGQNWSKFWDDHVTIKELELAQRLAVFVLIPIGVLLHEVGHSLATWQVGGTVSTFQWRFYWGYIIPAGDFSSYEYWWIAFSGNLVSLVLGLLPIPFIPYIHKRILGEILYSYACVQTIYALLLYPLLCLALRQGDWVNIYDFAVEPYAALTLVVHVGLLWGLWQLYHSRKAIRWRLARSSNTLETWNMLKTDIANQPHELQSHLKLAYFLLQNNEVHEAKKIVRKVNKIAPKDERVRVLRVVMDCTRGAYRKTVKSGRQLLNTNLSDEDQLRLYRILGFCLYKIGRPSEALSYVNQGLTVAQGDYKLRYLRAVVYQMQGQHQQARADLEVALESVPDEDSRQQIQQLLKQCKHQLP